MKQKIIVGIAFYTMVVALVSAIQAKEPSVTTSKQNDFKLSSTAVQPDGSLLSDFTGDGRGVSMPVAWTNAPKNTKYFALNLWHCPHPISNPTEIKSYWVIYNIPANVCSLPESVNNIGITGYNDKDRTDYDPMKSKGPGKKIYNLTIYALSEKPVFKTTKVYRADLLKAIKKITLDESTLTYTYERKMTASQLKEQPNRQPQEKMEPLTDLQKKKVKEILSKYDSNSLTAKDAKAIHEAFHKTGLSGGPIMDDAIKDSGFNPDKLQPS